MMTELLSHVRLLCASSWRQSIEFFLHTKAVEFGGNSQLGPRILEGSRKQAQRDLWTHKAHKLGEL